MDALCGFKKSPSNQNSKKLMIFCIRYESLGLQAVHSEHAVMCLVYKVVDLLLCAENSLWKILRRRTVMAIYLNSAELVLLQSISAVNYSTPYVEL